MRIAVSGAHCTGKTTLVGALCRSLPSFQAIDEPYLQLVEEGHVFADMPRLEDFELQLQRSIECVAGSQGDCLFDRCPADILAYLISHEDAASFDAQLWMADIEDAMQQLDWILFVPIEDPDCVPAGSTDHEELRQRVDEEIRKIVLDDEWGFGVAAIEVAGSLEQRTRQVVDHLAGRRQFGS